MSQTMCWYGILAFFDRNKTKLDMSSKIEINIGGMGLTNMMDEDSDFIPIIADEDESAIDDFEVPDSLPILPLRNTVLFQVWLFQSLLDEKNH